MSLIGKATSAYRGVSSPSSQAPPGAFGNIRRCVAAILWREDAASMEWPEIRETTALPRHLEKPHSLKLPIVLSLINPGLSDLSSHEEYSVLSSAVDSSLHLDF